MLNVKHLGLADVVVGIISFAFQVGLLAYCHSDCKIPENTATGIWGGIIFVVTGLYGFKFGFGHKMVMLCLSGLSLACAIILLVLSSSAVDSWYGNDTHVALNAILIICGIFSTVINAILTFIGLKS